MNVCTCLMLVNTIEICMNICVVLYALICYMCECKYEVKCRLNTNLHVWNYRYGKNQIFGDFL